MREVPASIPGAARSLIIQFEKSSPDVATRRLRTPSRQREREGQGRRRRGKTEGSDTQQKNKTSDESLERRTSKIRNEEYRSSAGKEASRGFEPRSLDSESRVLTVTPRGQLLIFRKKEVVVESKSKVSSQGCSNNSREGAAKQQEHSTNLLQKVPVAFA